MTTLTFKIPNISCSHCIHTIETELSELAGVKQIKGSVETKLVTIGYDDPATREVIEALLAEIDYPAEK